MAVCPDPIVVSLVYAMLFKAAESGKPCPSNSEIKEVIGCGSMSTPPKYIKILEDKGLIAVRRYQRFREVTIISTGDRTVRPERMDSLRPHKSRTAYPKGQTRQTQTRAQLLEVRSKRMTKAQARYERKAAMEAALGRFYDRRVMRGGV